MYDGYFAMGGREIGNSERARGLQESAECPILWIVDKERCETLPEALGHNPYTYDNIAEAPWYDPDAPDVSSRIFGLYVMSMTGLQDSTREAAVKQKVTAGAQIGRTRFAGKGVRVRAMLTAQGQDALDAGITWLDTALTADQCGLHESSCGLTDFEYFTSCPPARDLSVGYSDWAEVRRNLFANPRGTSIGPAFWRASGGTLSLRTDMSGDISTAVRWTRDSPGPASVSMVVGEDLPNTGIMHVILRVRASETMVVNIQVRPDVASGAGQVDLASGLTIPAGVSDFDLSGLAPTGVMGVDAGVTIYSSSGLVGSTLDVTSVLIESGTGRYFDGSSGSGTLERHSWVGWGGYGMGPYGEGLYGGDNGENWSQSIEETRVITDDADSVEQYYPIVDAYRRYLHQVKCISGPYVQEEFISNDGLYNAVVVEFVIGSEVSHVFTKPREIIIPPTIPSPIQDIPFNLVEYPSAEVSDGSDVVVAINHNLNPSLEVDATGWGNSAATVTGTSPAAYYTAGRVTGEVSASGTASYRMRILGNGATTASGRARLSAYSEVDLAGILSGSRVSFTMWAAVLNLGGATGASFLSLTIEAEWRNGATVLSTEVVGTTSTEFSGKAFSFTSRPIPATADNVRLYARAVVNWSSSATPASNSDIRVYVDAAGVTTP